MPFVRRRPLLRMAAVGGVAYMGAKAGTNKAMQAQQAQGQAPAQGQSATATSPAAAPAPAPAPAAAPAAPPAAAPAPAAPAGGNDPVAQLQQLAQLHQSGALSDEEFAQAKSRILG